MLFTPGAKVGPYHIVAPLGAGGMGEVYRAHDERLDRDLAIKVLPHESMGDETARVRLIREARTASSLNHPHIAHIYEVGEEAGHLFIAMEIVEGRPLQELIQEGAVPGESVVPYAAQIAEALAYAHKRGVIHRDLKSANIMITPEGWAKVLDFGLAKRIPTAGIAETRIDPSLTSSGMMVGTPNYLPPEVLLGEKADARSDVWSLGVLLYEMATGRLPFLGGTVGQLADAIVNAAPKSISTRVPVALRSVIARCLAKEPAARFQDGGEVSAALQALQKRGRRAGAGRRLWLPAAALVLVLAAGAAAIGTGRLRIPGFGAPGSAPPQIRSLAVLPLANLSGDPAQEYFADGMTEELITDLASIRSLKVISRTSAMRYKNSKQSLGEIARQLGVDGIVEGSVLRAGERVRITAQLIEAKSDRHLWAQSYERDMRDVLEMQSEVGRDIAERINVQLSPREQGRVTNPRPVNPEAYELYLRGRYYWNKRTQDALLQALDSFGRAVRVDPGYAVAYAGLADTYVLMGLYAGSPPQKSFPQARAAALKALKIDEHLAEAHASLGRVKLCYDWDWTGAETEFRRAIELKPSLSTAHHWYSICLRDVGRLNEAVAEAKRALELDPLSLIINTNLGDTYFYAGQFDQAIAQHRKTLLLDAGFAAAHLYLGRALEQKGMLQDAMAEFRKARSLAGKGPYALADLARAFALAGKRADARRLLNELTELSKRGASLDMDIALVHLASGDRAQAFQYLEKAYKERSGLNDLKVDPRFGSLHGDPRFQDLLVRLGLAG